MFRKFRISANHVSAKYRLPSRIVTVDEFNHEFRVTTRTSSNPAYPVRYTATARGFGCGKDCATPEDAIRDLLMDNGCTNIRIEEIKDEPPVDPRPFVYAGTDRNSGPFWRIRIRNNRGTQWTRWSSIRDEGRAVAVAMKGRPSSEYISAVEPVKVLRRAEPLTLDDAHCDYEILPQNMTAEELAIVQEDERKADHVLRNLPYDRDFEFVDDNFRTYLVTKEGEVKVLVNGGRSWRRLSWQSPRWYDIHETLRVRLAQMETVSETVDDPAIDHPEMLPHSDPLYSHNDYIRETAQANLRKAVVQSESIIGEVLAPIDERDLAEEIMISAVYSFYPSNLMDGDGLLSYGDCEIFKPTPAVDGMIMLYGQAPFDYLYDRLSDFNEFSIYQTLNNAELTGDSFTAPWHGFNLTPSVVLLDGAFNRRYLDQGAPIIGIRFDAESFNPLY